MSHRNASTLKRRPVRTAAFAAVATLLVGLPVVTAARLAPASTSVVEGDLQAPTSLRVRQTRPNFQAPTATTCSDAPVLREVADPYPESQQRRALKPSRSRHASAR